MIQNGSSHHVTAENAPAYLVGLGSSYPFSSAFSTLVRRIDPFLEHQQRCGIGEE